MKETSVMKSWSHFKKSGPVLSLLLLVSGCQFPLQPGKYSSRMTLNTPGQMILSDEPVRVNVVPSHSGMTAEILDFNTLEPKFSKIQVLKTQKNHLSLTVPFVQGIANTDLIFAGKKNSSQCFKKAGQKKSDENKIELCFNEEWFRLALSQGQLTVFRLVGNQVEPRKPLEEGKPVSLTLRQALDVLFEKSFEVQEAHQALVRADKMALKTYLKLLPHISAGTPVTATFAGMGEYYESRGPIGELIPFIFPNRWVKARAHTWSARAESYAKVTTKANALLALNTLGVSYAAHKEYKESLLDLLKVVNATSSPSLSLESAWWPASVLSLSGAFSPASMASESVTSTPETEDSRVVSTMIALLQKDLQTEINIAHNLVQQDRFNIAYALGSENPEFIDQLGLEGTKRIDQIATFETEEAKDAEVEKIKTTALQFSLELSQFESLRKAANLREKNVWIDWIDSFSNIGLGPSIVAERDYYKTFVTQVDIKANAARASIPKSAQSWVTHRNAAIKNYHNHVANRTTQAEQLAVVLKRGVKHPAAAADLKNAVKGMMGTLYSLYISRAVVEVKQAELDRLTRAGIYEYLSPHLGAQAE